MKRPSNGNTYDKELSLYSFKLDSIDCLRYLLLYFFDILDECLCYSTKLYGGGDKAHCGEFAEVMNTLNST